MAKAYPLVTGASGLTGTETVRALVAAGVDVRVTYREQAELNTLRELACETFHADYNEPATVYNAMKSANCVVVILPIDKHLAEWGKTVVDAAAQNTDIKRVVLLSNVAADAQADTDIARMHGEVAEHLKNSGVNYTIVRPMPYYQNLFWSTITIVRQKNISLPLNGKLPQIDVRDVGLFLAKAAQDDSESDREYTITGPESLTVFQMARMLSKEIGFTVRFMPAPVRAGKQCFRDMGLTPWLSEAIGGMYAEYDSGKYETPTDDFQKLAKRKPLPFSQFAADYKTVFNIDKHAADAPIRRGAV